MRLLTSITVFTFLCASLAASLALSPDHCTVLNTDANFPALEVWNAALPGVLPLKLKDALPTRPDYRFTARLVADVEKAVKFVTEYNLRLSIINTGHDYHGRNDPPSGLSLDVSQLRGVRVSSSLTPTEQGAKSLVPNMPVEITRQVPGGQAAATFGAGIIGSGLNRAIKSNKLFAVTGGASTVSIASDWGQSGGHSFISHLYGLGIDNFLEFKIVIADGKLKAANKVSNPDLIWALRGGGGATKGVVVESTVKVYPTPKMLLHAVYITSPNATTVDFMGIGNGKSAKGLWDAIAYLGSQFPDMVDRGSGGIFIPTTNGFVGAEIFTGENAKEAYAKSVWDPNLNKMKTSPGMGSWTTNSTAFPTYQDFFGTIWSGIGIINGDAGTGPGDSVRCGKMFRSFVDSKVITEANLGHLASGAYINEDFWGTKYVKLPEVKGKWDPKNVFWVSPGINADHMQARDGRVCKAPQSYADSLKGYLPPLDNSNPMDYLAQFWATIGFGVPYTGQNVTYNPGA